jgi:hypothetical protein
VQLPETFFFEGTFELGFYPCNDNILRKTFFLQMHHSYLQDKD